MVGRERLFSVPFLYSSSCRGFPFHLIDTTIIRLVCSGKQTLQQLICVGYLLNLNTDYLPTVLSTRNHSRALEMSNGQMKLIAPTFLSILFSNVSYTDQRSCLDSLDSYHLCSSSTLDSAILYGLAFGIHTHYKSGGCHVRLSYVFFP